MQTGLDLARDLIESRGTYAPLLDSAASKILDNPDRRHDADGVVPLGMEMPKLGDTVQDIAREAKPAACEAQIAAPNQKHASRVSVLTEAQGLVHGDRCEQYGPPAAEYARTAGMVNAMLAAKLREPLTPEDLAYIMICLKLSRQINKPKMDSLVDAAGYCEVAQWIIDSRVGRG
jgi:hypothetical protein